MAIFLLSQSTERGHAKQPRDRNLKEDLKWVTMRNPPRGRILGNILGPLLPTSPPRPRSWIAKKKWLALLFNLLTHDSAIQTSQESIQSM